MACQKNLNHLAASWVIAWFICWSFHLIVWLIESMHWGYIDWLLDFLQICPFPYDLIKQQILQYPNATLVFAQEEHKNGGAWTYVQPRIDNVLRHHIKEPRRIKWVVFGHRFRFLWFLLLEYSFLSIFLLSYHSSFFSKTKIGMIRDFESMILRYRPLFFSVSSDRFHGIFWFQIF